MSRLSELDIPGLCMIGHIGAIVKTEATRRAVIDFAMCTSGVMVASLVNDDVMESISAALELYDLKPCLLHDLNSRMSGRFLILLGVNACNDEVLEDLKIVTAQADCPVVAVIEACKPWEDVAAQFVAERIAQKTKGGV